MTDPLPRKATQQRLQGGPGAGVEGVRSEWVYTAPAGTQLTDVLAEAFWAGLNPRPQPWDHVEVREELGAWWCELLVRSSTSEGIVVAGIRAIELESVAPRNFQPFDAKGHKVVYRGPHTQWCVQASDGRVLHDGFADEKGATSWLASYLRTVNT